MRKNKKVREATNYTIVPKEVDGQNRSVEQQIQDLKGKVDNKNGDAVEVDEKNFESRVYTKKSISELRVKNLMERGKVFTKKQLLESVDDYKNTGSPFIDYFVKIFGKENHSYVRTGLASLLRTYAPFEKDGRGKWIPNETKDNYLLKLDDNGEIDRSNGAFTDVDILLNMVYDKEFNQNETWLAAAMSALNSLVRHYTIPDEHFDSVISIYKYVMSITPPKSTAHKRANSIMKNVAKPINAVKFTDSGEIDKRFNLDGDVKPYKQPLAVDKLQQRYNETLKLSLNRVILDTLNDFIEKGEVNDVMFGNVRKQIYDTIDERRNFNDQVTILSKSYIYLFALIIGDENLLDLTLKDRFGFQTNLLYQIVGSKGFDKKGLFRLFDDIENKKFKRDYTNLIDGLMSRFKKGKGIEDVDSKKSNNKVKPTDGEVKPTDGELKLNNEARLRRIIGQIISEKRNR